MTTDNITIPTKLPASPSKFVPVWKGKAKATESDYEDLRPIITYRHLHSHNLGVKDPLRVVSLCDSDAFYAACEQLRLGIDPGRPLVVLQWQALIAVNYPARKYGISRMDKLQDAKKRCAHLEVVHVATYKEGEAEPGYWENPDTLTHKVSLDYYRRESWKIYHMFKDGLPTGEVEKASIDEAFLDLTRPVREEILRRYPYLLEVPPDAPLGKDTPLPPPPPITWDGLGTVIPIYLPPKQSDSTEEDDTCNSEEGDKGSEEIEGIQENDDSTTWHDVALSIAAEFMDKIRQDIYSKLGYSTSAGIARNKFLAKLTASYKKPNNQSILRNAAIPNYLRPMPFQKIRFLGGKLGKALAEEYDASTVGDLLTVSLDEIQRKFGEEAIWVWEILRGIDRTDIKEKAPVTKSMQASKNLPQPIVKASQGHHWIRVLDAELALRLREARETIPALWPKSIVLHVRQGYDASRSKQAPFPFIRDITVDVIAALGDKLWRELAGTDTHRTAPMKITNVSLSFSGIESAETGQRRIEGFFQKPQSSGGSADQGGDASLIESHLVNSSSSIKRKRAESNRATDEVVAMDEINNDPTSKPNSSATSSTLSFHCKRCRKQISYEDGAVQSLTSEMLDKFRREHDDFHFAQDLAKEGLGDSGVRRAVIRPSESIQEATKKRKHDVKTKRKGTSEEPKGSIAKFFPQR